MATTWTIDQLQKLEEAYALGATKVKYADKEVEYRSLGDMDKIITRMKKALGIVSSAPARVYPSFSKGLDCG